MIVGISSVYIELVHRFVKNVGPKSLAHLSKDSLIPIAELESFDRSGKLDPEKVMKLWSLLFPDSTFLQASSYMDAQGFSR